MNVAEQPGSEGVELQVYENSVVPSSQSRIADVIVRFVPLTFTASQPTWYPTGPGIGPV